MRRKPTRQPMKGGLDRVGWFHPYVAYLAVMLVNLAGVIIIVAVIALATDWIEDLF